MSLALRIVLPLTSGPGRARMRPRLECEIRGGRYHLFAQEGQERWRVLLPGTSLEAEEVGLTRADATRAGLLAGFGPRVVERALRKAEAGRKCS